MDWDKLKIFHNVALDLNISEAANKMNISHSSISRQISSLERDLKVSLFKRHANSRKKRVDYLLFLKKK